MKKRIIHRTVGLALAVLLILSGALPSMAAQARISRSTAEIVVSQYLSLSTSGLKGKIVWRSSAPQIVQVSQQGKIKGVKAGQAVITASAANAKVSCKVRVFNIGFDRKSYTIQTDRLMKLTLKSNAAKGIAWRSSDPSVIRIMQTNKDYAILRSFGKAGSVMVYAKFRGKVYQCRITVKKAALPTPVPVSPFIPVTVTPTPIPTPMRAAYVPPVTDSVVTGLEKPLVFKKGVSHSFRVTGANASQKYGNSLLVGDGGWSPIYWAMTPNPGDSQKQARWAIAATQDVNASRTYPMYIFFRLLTWDGTAWVNTDRIESITVTLRTAAF
ncbi:MAG: Ig-like domain-containing protein [Blautia sp.]|nr:Ig-like domain-containing protein [Blautia sp.]